MLLGNTNIIINVDQIVSIKGRSMTMSNRDCYIVSEEELNILRGIFQNKTRQLHDVLLTDEKNTLAKIKEAENG